MADIKQLENALKVLDTGLSLADKLAGWVGRLRTPERQAHYARWRSLRLELRAAKAAIRGRTMRSEALLAKSQIWAEEANRLETQICKTP